MFNNRKVMITGGKSMLGRHLTKLLWGFCHLDLCPHSEVDFTIEEETKERFEEFEPDYVISLAGYNGNIKFNSEYPADIFEKNTKMAINILKYAHLSKVKKLLYIMPSCAYPPFDILEEKDMYGGKPHNSVECHGLSRQIYLSYSRQLHRQHGCNFVGMAINTAYGEFDSFDVNKTKVVGGLITKTFDAINSGGPLVVWGTGKAKRGFIYAGDVAQAILQVMRIYNNPDELINIESEEISIKDLAYLIAEIAEYKGEIIFKGEDGQMRKMLKFDKQNGILHSNATSLREGLIKTIKWYKENYYV